MLRRKKRRTQIQKAINYNFNLVMNYAWPPPVPIPGSAAGKRKARSFKDDEAKEADGDEEEAAAAPAPAGVKVARIPSGAKPTIAAPGEAAYASLGGSPAGSPTGLTPEMCGLTAGEP